MKKSFIFLLTFFLASSSYAQWKNNTSTDDRIRTLQIQVGQNFGYFKDLNFSPLNYKMDGILFSADHIRTTKKGNILRYHLDYGQGNLTSSASERFTSGYLIGSAKFDFWKKLNTQNKNLTILLGPGYGFDFDYYEFENQDAISFLVGHNLNVGGMVKYNLNEKHTLSSSFSLSLLSFVNRPPYAGFDEQLEIEADKPLKLLTSVETASLNKYISFDWGLNYTYQMTSKLDLNLGYNLKYQRYNDVKQFTQAQNQINLGLTYKF